MARKARGRVRVVFAPAPEPMSGELPPNRVVSVTSRPGEDVEWIWTSVPGGRYVSGYRIVKASRAPSLEEVLAKYQGK